MFLEDLTGPHLFHEFNINIGSNLLPSPRTAYPDMINTNINITALRTGRNICSLSYLGLRMRELQITVAEGLILNWWLSLYMIHINDNGLMNKICSTAWNNNDSYVCKSLLSWKKLCYSTPPTSDSVYDSSEPAMGYVKQHVSDSHDYTFNHHITAQSEIRDGTMFPTIKATMITALFPRS